MHKFVKTGEYRQRNGLPAWVCWIVPDNVCSCCPFRLRGYRRSADYRVTLTGMREEFGAWRASGEMYEDGKDEYDLVEYIGPLDTDFPMAERPIVTLGNSFIQLSVRNASEVNAVLEWIERVLPDTPPEPQLLEYWVNLYPDDKRIMNRCAYSSPELARKYADASAATRVAVHLREVIE